MYREKSTTIIRNYIHCAGCSYDHPEDARFIAYVGQAPTTFTEWNARVVSWICWDCIDDGDAVEDWAAAVRRDWPDVAFAQSSGSVMDHLVGPDHRVLPLLPFDPD